MDNSRKDNVVEVRTLSEILSANKPQPKPEESKDINDIKEAPAVKEAPPVREVPQVKEAPPVREVPQVKEAPPVKAAPAVKAAPRVKEVKEAPPVSAADNGIYLDDIYDTAEDKKDIETAKGKVMSPADKRIITVLWILNALVFAFIGIFVSTSGGSDPYESVKEEVRFETDSGPAIYYDSTEIFSDSITPNLNPTEYPEGMLKGFESLYATNSDTVGWLRIEDTNIDHVVLQTDNHTDYDRTTFYGEYYVGGSIFMDYRNKVGKGARSLSKNTIVYGHYLQNQRGMFTDLEKYSDVEYYREHPIIELSTLYSSYRFKIIGAFIAAVEEKYDNKLFYYWYDDFSDSNTLGFANEVAFRSYFINPAVDVQPTDKFLTLSTCSHSMDIDGMVNARFVVVARLVRDGEDPAVDTAAAYQNTSQRMPQYWYDRQGLTNPYAQYAIWDAFA